MVATQERVTSTYCQKQKGEVQHVLIVYPYTYINPYCNLPPIGAEYLQAGIIEAGRTTTLLDMRFEKRDISEHIAKADVVCLYGFFEDCSLFGKWGIHVIDDVLAQIPEDKPVVAGGTGFGDANETMEKYAGIDVHIVGMPNDPIKQLLETGAPDEILNLTFRTDQGVQQNQRTTHRLSDDVYPRRELRNPRYKYEMVGIPIDLVRAAQGCNYRCKFCYQYGKDTDGNYLRWQGRSPESQYKELSEIKAPFILWVDDDMTTDMKALDKLSDLLIENKVEKIMIGTGRVDHVVKSDVEKLKKLERAGFLALAFGVESLSDKTLRFYRKGQTVAMAEKAMSMIKQTNIMLVCNFLLGSPGETEEDMMEFLWFGGRHGVDHLVTNRLRVPEGGPLYSMVYDENGDALPGMERIRGRRLKRIKNRIKFGQGSPFKLALTFLKLHRHKGLHLDPLYLICSALETMGKGTWLDKTKILPTLVFVPKHLGRLRAFRWFTRWVAIGLTPLFKAMAGIYEGIDRRFGISTTIMPAFASMFSRKVLDRQKRDAQLGDRPISEKHASVAQANA